ncbi:hypothetical protein [Micromonospora sp. NPDC000668]|uniref:hypothetical protein n=1 Tax=Micromonospora sp. NPDC000668 TaxID=3364219 RepID=UPI0036AEC84C
MPVGWPTRDVAGGQTWPSLASASAGSTRPAGPARPPTRRDPRRPAGTARPAAGPLEAGRGAATSLSVPTVDGGGPDVERRGDPAGTADGSRDVDRRGRQLVGPAGMPVGGPRGAGAPARVPPSPARVLLLVGLAGAGTGAVLAGPVAAVAAAGYGMLAVRALLRWRTNRQVERNRRRGLDQLCGLAADLRAGLPVPSVVEVANASGSGGADRLRQLTSAAVRLADRTGAPLAELVERIEADARATDRGLAAAAAQAAGARATAWLLAALPIGGIGLGYGVGVDPVAVLLHSTVGGVCAVLAVALQVVGLFWAERLGATPGRAG